MRSGRVSGDVATAWLGDIKARATHLGLSSGDPFGGGDPLTMEPTGGIYHRCLSALAFSSGQLISNSFELIWTGLPAGTVIAYYVGWDAPFNGNPVFSAPRTPLTLPSGGVHTIPASQFYWGLAT